MPTMTKTLCHEIFDRLTSEVVVIDQNGTIFEVNDAWRRFASDSSYGSVRCPNFFLGASYLAACDSDSDKNPYAKSAGDGIRAVLAQKLPFFSMAYPCHTPSKELWFIMHVTPLGTGAIIEHIDITAHRQAELRIHQSECLLRSIFDEASSGILIADVVSARFIDANPAILRMLGYSRVELLAKGVLDIHPKEALPAVLEAFNALARGERNLAVDVPVLRKDGSEFFADITAARIIIDGRQCAAGFITDVTERMSAELKEREGQQALRAIMDLSLDGFLLMDTVGLILDVNIQYCRLSGYVREELVGKNVQDLHVNESTVQPDEYIKKVIELGQYNFETMHRHLDGTAWYVEGNISYRDVAGGQLLACIRDVTQRKQVEAELLLAKSKAEKSDKAKSHFLAAVTHDLRQPLAALSLYVDVLSSNAPGTLEEVVPRIKGCTDNLAWLLGDLLNLSKLQTGAVIPTITNMPVAELLDMLQSVHAVQASQKGLHLRVRPSTLTLSTDRALILRILNNLVANAVKYTNRGGVLIACRRHNQRHWLEVYDTGIGIDEDQIENVFSEFHQLGNNVGSGLGLFIVEKAAELLGLRLRVRSSVGRGSMFAVELPITPTPLVAMPLKLPEKSALRIALVEDNTEVLQAMTLILESMGHEVIFAEASVDVISRLDGNAPDLLITDYHLSAGKNGVEVIEDARSIFGEQLPSLIITADTDKSRLSAMAQKGIVMIFKPVRLETLRTVIMQLAEKGQQLQPECLAIGLSKY